MEINEFYRKNFESCEQKVIQLYKTYANEICPLIILLETIDNEYPAEIINEIRATFTHLSRYYGFIEETNNILNEDVMKQLEFQIELAERHIKRAKLDCFKFACLTLYRTRNLY